MGFHVTLVGRLLPDSQSLSRNYKTHRMKLLSQKGPLFYAEYNIRLFIYLLFHKVNLIVSNDLDTLLSCYLAYKIKNAEIVYDSHEYYTGTPELVNRPEIRNFWKKIEAYIFPKLTDIITVNDSIARLYSEEYNKSIIVVRNVPRKPDNIISAALPSNSFDATKHLVILQGAGINIQRGAEEAIMAMEYVDNAILLIIGSGDVIELLKQMTMELGLEERVIFMPRKPYNELMQYTAAAKIGLTLDKDTNINYRFSLPNKLFDYIQAGTPVLASPLPEVKKIVEKYQVGMLIENHNPQHIASCINKMLEENYKEKLKNNLLHAAKELNWENEEEVLKQVYSKYV